MNNFLKKIKFEKFSVYLLILAFLLLIILLYSVFSTGVKGLKLITPNQGETWEIGQTYSIVWESQNIEKVGIVLFQGKEPQWIAKNINAKLKKHEWTIQFGQDFGSNYWIAIFEYPWHEKALIDYSIKSFTIAPSDYFTCEQGSIDQQWLYLPGDLPGLRKVFITSNTYKGDLGGLEGADQICQNEAQILELDGQWLAFMGGEQKGETIVERLEKTTKGLTGIFIEAKSDFDLGRDQSCYRFIAKDLEEFLKIFSGNKSIYSRLLSPSFFAKIDKIWLGRINQESKETCIFLPDVSTFSYLSEKYSSSSTCQNWTREDSFVTGYREREEINFPQCFTPEGERTDAVRLGGLSSASFGVNFVSQQGKVCDTKQYLLCIES
ncbi:MAG: hypothetical protein PHN37_01265 [Candidatus Pacebacteria bacterium]|nr:hypothetical protein [Candidatus Paceibacterota bacterium]